MKKLSFAILCNGTLFPKFEAEAILKILEIPEVECVALIIDKDARNFKRPVSRTFFKKFFPLKDLGYRILTALETKKGRENLAKNQIDLSEKLIKSRKIEMQASLKGKFSQYFTDDDICTLKELNLDFILRFGFNILRGEIHQVARFGVWSYHHGDELKYRGSPAGLWEIYNNDPINGAILQRLNDKLDSGVILYKGYFRLRAHSIQKNYENVLNGCTDWPAKVCKDILYGDYSYINGPATSSTAPIYKKPDNIKSFILIYKLVLNTVIFYLKNRFIQPDWRIGIVHKKIDQTSQKDLETKVQWIPRFSNEYYLADPFGVPYKDKGCIIFAERCSLKSNRGDLVCIKSDDGVSFDPPVKVLPSSFHQSYPFLLNYENEYYCIPESHESNEVVLFKAKKFPFEWERELTLIKNFSGVDSTMFFYNGYWWIFTHDQNDYSLEKLFIFYSEKFTGPYLEHKTNPVKCDIRNTRSGGTPFIREGRLFRPTQNGVHGYGHHLVVNEVVKLTPSEFFEKESYELFSPKKNNRFTDGIHHLATLGESQTLIDVHNKKIRI